VRHGESEANKAHKADRGGDPSLFTDEFRERHDSDMRLTSNGVEQAQAAGAWMMSDPVLSSGEYTRCYYSPHRRTVETAGNLGLDPDSGWLENDLIRERDWGEFGASSEQEKMEVMSNSVAQKEQNALYWCPTGGESLATGVRTRFERFLGTLHRDMAEQKVLMITHGEYIDVARFVLERLTVPQWLEMNDDRAQKIQNCMILHYTRENPSTGELAKKLTWMRAICPWDKSLSHNEGEWQTLSVDIGERAVNDKQLLYRAEEMPRLFE